MEGVFDVRLIKVDPLTDIPATESVPLLFQLCKPSSFPYRDSYIWPAFSSTGSTDSLNISALSYP